MQVRRSLFFKCLPSKTLDFKHNQFFDGKHSKEQVIVTVCLNMNGTEILRLLIIEKSKNPKCFKEIKSLKTKYDFKKKA